MRMTIARKVGVLLILATCGSLLALGVAVWYVRETVDDPSFINVAGRQRLLGQQMVTQLVTALDPGVDLGGLEATVASFETALRALETGGAVDGRNVPRAPAGLESDVRQIRLLWDGLRPSLLSLPVSLPERRDAIGRLTPSLQTLVLVFNDLLLRFEQLRRERRQIVLGAFAGAFLLNLLLLGAGVVLTKYVIVRQVKLLEAGARRVEAADYSMPVPIVTDDELATLTAAFNQMVEERRRREHDLSRQRDELDFYALVLGRLIETPAVEQRLAAVLDEVRARLKSDVAAAFLVENQRLVLKDWRHLPDGLRAHIMSFPAGEAPELFTTHTVIHEPLSAHGRMPGFMKAEGIQSLVTAPLSLPTAADGKADEWLGALLLCARRCDAFDADHVRLVRRLAVPLSLAIDHARAYRQATERLVRLRALREVDASIIQRLNLPQILRGVLDRLPSELGADAAAISLLSEQETKASVFVMRLPNGTYVDKEAFVIADFLLHWFQDRHEPMYIADVMLDPRVRMYREVARKHKLVSYLGIPLEVHGRLIGVLHVLTTRPRTFSDEDLAFFVTMAGQASVAIQGAQTTWALELSEARYRRIVETASEGICLLNAEGRIEYANRQMAELLGTDAANMTGHSFLDFIPDPTERSLLRRWLTTGAVERAELRCQRPNGQPCYALVAANPVVDDEGNRLGTLVMVTDMTERRLTEEQRARLLSIVEDAVGPIFITTSEGVITYINRAFERVTGYSASEAIGRTPKLLKSGAEDPDLYTRLWQTIRSGQKWSGEIRNRRKDGSLFTMEETITPVLNEEGRIVSFFSIGLDVTERKSLEAQLRQAQKMEAVGQLAGGIAHDFNNILTAIAGYTELLLDKLKEDPGTVTDLQEIKYASDRAASMTARLLAFGRKQVLQPRVIDLNALVSDSERMLRRVIREHIEIAMEQEPTLSPVSVDPAQLQEMLLNLALNAQDAMPGGGVLTLASANAKVDRKEARRLALPAAGSYVLLEVRDTGHGMSPDIKARIFEPFFTTKDPGKGTGLGLSMVYGFVKQSGGAIWVESEPGLGTTFRIYLPATAGTLDDRQVSGQPELPRGGHETVLIVEDDEGVRCLMKRILRRHGYGVLEASSGTEALSVAKQHDGPIDLLLSDVIMPGMSGTDVWSQLRAARKRLRVLFVSGYTGGSIPDLTFVESMGRFLRKPFTPDELAAKVREAIDSE
ncbi:MAG: PAS domain S-box protein [Acidobacteria bacterium]|nr:PAS domain S-box protein [Acidobacteriota bacterium]